jgi:diguanylate cyclase (GGDEF)-like protein
MNQQGNTPTEGYTAKILVLDDDEMVGDVIVESVRAEGHEAEYCADGKTAIEKTKETAYDLIITDMRLPGLDGLSLIRSLNSTNSETDVIVITGYGSIENAVECMKAGALDYLIKPFTVDQMVVAVRKALDHRDLKRRAKEREFYRELSYMDALTRCYNRRFFDEALAAEIRKAMEHETGLVLLMIDIDDFKIYNDNHGHQKGDEVLTRIGEILRSACRGYDIVTRYGGEEFAVLFPGAGKENAPMLAARIMSHMRNTRFPGEEVLPLNRLTVSIGAACCPENAGTAQELVKAADEALYEAKKQGKNGVILAGTR